MSNTKSIMIVGVGGQGTLLASRLLGNILLNSGFDVKISEVHGMSQRGGSVVTYVKYGDKVYSPVIDMGEADYLIAFEQCECARFMSYLKKGGKILSNTQQIDPMPVITGAATYPAHIETRIKEKGIDLKMADALSLAEEAGSAKSVNIVLMGMLSGEMDFEEELWLKTLEETVPPKFLELNKKAFTLGRNSVLNK